MKILIVNVAWIENGWQEIDNKTKSGHEFIKQGGIAHESVNFKFDGIWNDDNIYGFCQFTNQPLVDGNGNIVVFYSDKKIVGIYTEVEFGKFEPDNRPKEIEYFNMKANKDLSFKLDTYLNFDYNKYLPDGKQKIGQIGFTYIGKEQLFHILNDSLPKNLDLFDSIEDIKSKYFDVTNELNWDNFIKTIDFTKIEKIQKKVKDENMDEGIRIFHFLESFRNYLPQIIQTLSKYKKGKNKATHPIFGTRDNGFRVGFYYGHKDYAKSTQLNITIGADWGGGIFIVDNKNMIFGNLQLLNYLDNKYSNFSFKGNDKTIWAIFFKNQLDGFPSEKEVFIAIKKLSEIFEIMIKANKMKQKINLLEYQKQIILQGPPGTGKTRLAKQMANFMINGDVEPNIEDIKEQVKLIQFHPSYSYEDFVRGIVATTTEDGKGVKYETQNKILATMAEKAKDALGDEYYKKDTSDERKKEILKEADKYILIIDEINRANLSSVLGELIYALEYRDEAVESMYELDKNRKIILPSNLYIIGTMNTADRSTGYIDYAIRRRFTFVDVLPDKDVVNSNSKFNEVQKLFKKEDDTKEDDIKADTLSIEFNPDDVMLGHSYFIADSDEELENKFKYQVIPLLKEYIKDGVLNEKANDKIKEL